MRPWVLLTQAGIAFEEIQLKFNEAGEVAGIEPYSPTRQVPVLIVDDNVDAAESLALFLRVKGHQTVAAHAGLEALARAGNWHPDVMLLDIGLPDIDGYEVCRRVRAEPWGRAMAVLAITGWGQPHDRREAELAGFTGHFVKPVDPTALLARLQRPLPRPPQPPRTWRASSFLNRRRRYAPPARSRACSAPMTPGTSSG
jgi:CheY-like chemotaxis protein